LVNTNRSDLVERIAAMLEDANRPDLVERLAMLLEDAKRSELAERIAALLREIGARIDRPEPIDEEAQVLLGQLSATLPYLVRLKNAEINVAQAELAVRAVLSSPPEKAFAGTIVTDLTRRVDIYKSAVRSIANGRTPATFALVGVLSHVIALVSVVLVFSHFMPCDLEGGERSVCWVRMVIAGAVGGATSLLVRLNELAALSRWSSEGDPRQLFYTGLLKPVVGIVAGLFAYAAFSTGLITVQVPGQEGTAGVFYTALAFLAGFSERFVNDLTNSAVSVLGKE
jgi:hypothetical protein